MSLIPYDLGNWENMIVENCVSIDIDNIVRKKKLELLSELRAKGQKLSKKELKDLIIARLERSRFAYKDAQGEITQKLLIEDAPTNFGGLRIYFRCPVHIDRIFCGRRVRKLYLDPLGKFFGCRQCLSLTYLSCMRSNYRNKQHIGRYRSLVNKRDALLRANKDYYLRNSRKRGRRLLMLLKEIEKIRSVALDQTCPV